MELKFPIIYVIIGDLNHGLKNPKYKSIDILNQYLKENNNYFFFVSFSDPVSDYMSTKESNKKVLRIKPEEIFAEMFANYMMYDKHMLSNDNYRILKAIIPELK